MRALADGLLTYWLHSSVLLGLAALGCALLRQRHLGLQEAWLRAALVAGVLSASLQVGLGLRPLNGVVEFARALAPAAEPRPDVTPVKAPERQLERHPRTATSAVEPAPPRVAARAPLPAASASWARVWPGSLVGLWCALALLAVLRLARSARHLRALLRDRRPLRGGSVQACAERLAPRLGLAADVRLSLAPHLDVPLARGLWRPEVCLPARALSELGEDERLALCAHELAHVARRDPAWLLLARLIEALAPLQPLNLWARRRLQDVAECLSDDLAVQASARPLGLARCLVDVATWTMARSTLNPVAVAHASGARSHLGHRVERLMDDLRPLERPRRLLLPLLGAVVLATAFVPPVLSAGGAGAPRDPAAPPPPTAAPARPPVPPRALPAPRPVAPRAPLAVAAPAPAPEPVVEPEAPEAAELDADLADADEMDADQAEVADSEAHAQHEAAQQARLAERQARLEARTERLHARLAPHQERLEALSTELARASVDLAHAQSAEARAAQRAQVEQLRRALRTQADQMRVPRAEIEALAREARALAEQARPSEQALRELRRDAERAVRVDVRGLNAQVREELREARQELQRAAEELRRAAEELRRRAHAASQPEAR